MGYKIKEARKAKNMSQEELAKKSGISRVTISGLENGTIENTSMKTLSSISNALGMTLQDIFCQNTE